DHRPVHGQPEQAGLGISSLRARGDRADFDEAEPLPQQRIGNFAVLVEACSHAQRVREGKTRNLGCQPAAGSGGLARQSSQGGDGEAVGTLWIEREQRGAKQTVRHARPMAAPPNRVDAADDDTHLIHFLGGGRFVSPFYKLSPVRQTRADLRPEGLNAVLAKSSRLSGGSGFGAASFLSARKPRLFEFAADRS